MFPSISIYMYVHDGDYDDDICEPNIFGTNLLHCVTGPATWLETAVQMFSLIDRSDCDVQTNDVHPYRFRLKTIDRVYRYAVDTSGTSCLRYQRCNVTYLSLRQAVYHELTAEITTVLAKYTVAHPHCDLNV